MAINTAANIMGLSPSIIDALQHVFSHYPQIEKVVIFGSRARESHRPGSDIDIAVFASALTEQEFSGLWSDIDELSIAFKMDLIHFDTLGNAELKKQILRNGRPIYLSETAT